MNKKTVLSELLMIFGTMIWGVAFVFQDLGMNYVSPITFNVERSFVASIFLICFYFIYKLSNKKDKKEEEKKYTRKDIIFGSILCGFFLSLGMITQQIGITMEGAGKAGFITALYIIFVPIIGLFMKKKVNFLLIVGIIISILGLIFINFSDGQFSWGNGSWLLLGCAISYAFQILSVDYYSKRCNAILLTAGQFIVAFILHFPLMFIFEKPEIMSMLKAWGPVLFCGVVSSGIAYTIQVYTQKNIHPTIASLIMSLESIFSIIAASIILKEKYGLLEILGCVLLFSAIIIAQIPLKKKNSKS